MRIHTTEDPILRTRCTEVKDADIETLASIADRAAEAMYASGGCGIAAPQVGIDKRFCVVDVWWDPDDDSVEKSPMFLFNPKIVESSEETELDAEGCLSVVGVTVFVERSKEIVVEFIDEHGVPLRVEADGKFARCLQHEIDHLDGITIVDRLAGIKKVLALSYLIAAKNKGLVQGDKPIYVVR